MSIMPQKPIKRLIGEAIEESLKRIQEEEFPDFKIPEINLENSDQERHGDYASNIALELSDKIDREPMEIAKKIISVIENEHVGKIEAVEPGFINFLLKILIFKVS